MAIRLLSVDVDGTITNGRNQVTQATADALRRAAAAGVIVTLNTGRNLCESQMVLDRVPEIRYLMGCTGAFLMDVQQHERLSNHTLDIVTARQVNAIFRKYDTLIGIFYDDLVCNQADEIGAVLSRGDEERVRYAHGRPVADGDARGAGGRRG